MLIKTFIGLTFTSIVAGSNLVDKYWPSFLSRKEEDIVQNALETLYKIGNSTQSKCEICRETMNFGKSLALQRTELFSEVFTRWCEEVQGKKPMACDATFGEATVHASTRGGDMANALTLMDLYSIDGDYFCYYQMSKACPLPATPNIDISYMLPPKPDNVTTPKESGETFNILHLSDFHLSLDYEAGQEANCTDTTMCCTKNSYNKHLPKGEISVPALPWGSYSCDLPEIMIQDGLRGAVSLGDNENLDFEFTLYTGDLVDHSREEFVTLENVIEGEARVFKDMKKALKDIPVYATLGNHDCFPYGQLAPENSGFENKHNWNADLFADLWTDYGWIKNDKKMEVKTHYAGFSITPKPGLKIISYNSNTFYKKNVYAFYNMTHPDQFGTLQFLIDELSASELIGERVWIISHIPIGYDDTLPIVSESFTKVVERFSPSTIAAIFYGHTHYDEFAVMYANNATEKSAETALNVGLISQSLSTFTDNNPSFRYYEIDSNSYSVINAYNYYTKLNDTFSDPDDITELVWEFEYSARDVYDVNGTWPANAPLNATFWHNAAKEIRVNPTVAQKFYEFKTRFGPTVGDCSSEDCREALYCLLTSFTTPLLFECPIDDLFSFPW